MNTELYDMWIKSHRIESGVDIADTVMNCVVQKSHKPSVVKQTCETILLNLMQAKVFVRACVLVSGAVMGILRMTFQIYSVLFT